MADLSDLDWKIDLSRVKELRLYTTDLDDFLTDQRNDILGRRIPHPHFTGLGYVRGNVDPSAIDERRDIDYHLDFTFTTGTRLVPNFIGVAHVRQFDDEGKPPHLRSYWPKEYGQKYPIVQEVRVLNGSELRNLYERYSASRTAENASVSSQIRELEDRIRELEEGRNPALRSMLDFLQAER